jgi:hypothetical protein
MTTQDERESVPPPGHDDDERDGISARPKKLVERLIKRGIESGFEAFTKSEDTVRNVIDKIKDRELASLALDQIDETKNGLYRAVAKEMRDFLDNTSLASELKKALTGLAFEVKMEVRFKSTEDENGKSSIRPSVDGDIQLKDKSKKS